MAYLTNWLIKKRLEIIGNHISGRVLDIGCGKAEILNQYQGQIDHYTGIDIDASQINVLKSQFPLHHFIVRNIDDDSFAVKDQFDSIILLAVIEHVFNLKHVMSELVRCLKDDGRIIMTTPTNFGNDIVHKLGSKFGIFAQAAQADHICIFNRDRLAILAREVNLEIESYRQFQLFCNQIVVLKKSRL